MRSSKIPSFSWRYIWRGGLIVGGCLILTGCRSSTPNASASVGTPGAPTSNQPLQQQVQNDPNLPPERKQQIADNLARSQQAANDPRNRKGRPTTP